jgi:hypothetical protein
MRWLLYAVSIRSQRAWLSLSYALCVLFGHGLSCCRTSVVLSSRDFCPVLSTVLNPQFPFQCPGNLLSDSCAARDRGIGMFEELDWWDARSAPVHWMVLRLVHFGF